MIVRAHYSRQAIVLCVALGMALGMVAWALFIHDSRGGFFHSGQEPPTAPSRR
jgi:hypothetical protein